MSNFYFFALYIYFCIQLAIVFNLQRYFYSIHVDTVARSHLSLFYFRKNFYIPHDHILRFLLFSSSKRFSFRKLSFSRFYVMCIFVAHIAYKAIIYRSYIYKYFMNYSKWIKTTWNQLKSLEITSGIPVSNKLKYLSK